MIADKGFHLHLVVAGFKTNRPIGVISTTEVEGFIWGDRFGVQCGFMVEEEEAG